jgi:effector-binding domain-containing protein
METKIIPSKKYFCYMEQTTMNLLPKVIEREIHNFTAEIKKLGLKEAGPMEFIYFNCTEDADKLFTFLFAMPVETLIPLSGAKYFFREMEDFKSLSYIHKGDLLEMFQVYERIFKEVDDRGLKHTSQVREVYIKYEDIKSPDNVTEIQVGIA